MAAIVHSDYLEALLGGGTQTIVDVTADTIKLCLTDLTDSGTITIADVDLADINGGTGLIATGPALGSKTTTAGVYDSTAQYVFTAVATADEVDYITMFKDTGTPTTSPLIVTWDSASTGIPFTPNGGDVNVTFNASGVFQI